MAPSLSFNRFEIRPAERTLLMDGAIAPLGGRAFDVLMALVERRERVVSKNELLDLAWPGVVVEENNLSVQISSLRKVLGNQAIATVTGRGYRFAEAPLEPPFAGHATERIAPADDSDRIVRRLAAVVFANVAGWSQLVEADATSAVRAWKAVRVELIEAQLPAFGARPIEVTPDRLFLEFPSAVDAVRWGVDFQERLAIQRQSRHGAAIHMHIGISVEDVIVDQGRLLGEGLGIAAALQQAGDGDDVIVTKAVRDLASNKLAVRFQPLGKRHFEGVRRTIALFRVAPGDGASESARNNPHVMWAHRPAVAVLPFANEEAVADPYFGDGITEEIITCLSRNRSLFVIARNSTLRFRDRSIGIAEVAAQLGIRYVLVGLVRRDGRRLRIGVELVDATTEVIIWSQRFDGADEDLFGFQEQIAASIAGAIDPHLQDAEIAHVRDRPTDSFSAYDCVLRGVAVQYRFHEPDFALAGAMFRRAIELDPTYAQAHAHLAWWHNLCVGEGRTDDANDDGRQADVLSLKAVELDPRDAWVLSVAGHIQSFQRKRFTAALELFDQALALDPNCAVAWARSATTLAYVGRGEEALARVRNAMRLSPLDHQSFSFYTTNGTACIVEGRYDEAAGWLNKAHRLNPRYRAATRNLIAALALSGEVAEARALAQEFLQGEPGFGVAHFGSWYPLCQPHLGRMLGALEEAGLPA